jgi:hypothetical protein
LKKIQFIGLILLILSACSPQPTPLPIITFTPSPTVQARTTPVSFATVGTPVVQTTSIVGTPTACVDSALNTDWTLNEVPYNFTDVGKNRTMPPNEHFTVSWSLKNTGTCTWDSSYVVAFVSGYRMARSASYPIIAEGTTVAPGQGTIVNISMVAPEETGGFHAVWQLQSKDGTSLLKFTLVVKVDKGSYSPPSSPIALTYKSGCSAGFETIRLSWVDTSNNEDGYRVYRNSKMLVELPANTDSVLDAVPGAGKYAYTVVAFNVSGEGSANTFAEVTACK